MLEAHLETLPRVFGEVQKRMDQAYRRGAHGYNLRRRSESCFAQTIDITVMDPCLLSREELSYELPGELIIVEDVELDPGHAISVCKASLAQLTELSTGLDATGPRQLLRRFQTKMQHVLSRLRRITTDNAKLSADTNQLVAQLFELELQTDDACLVADLEGAKLHTAEGQSLHPTAGARKQ
ncbi:hypothetical protein CBL_20199, partial [Carabus blaptoides fortunei]